MITIDDLDRKAFQSLIGKKMAFIQPRYPFRELESAHGLDKFTSILPNYGALQLLTYIRQLELLGEVRYFESTAYNDDNELENSVRKFFDGENGILSATCYTATLKSVKDFFSRFDNTNFLKVAGGPHITPIPDTSFAHIAVRGAGEKTLEDVIRFFPDLDSVKRGIAYRNSSGKVIRPPTYNEDLDLLPLPDFELIETFREEGMYRSSFGKPEGEAAVYLTSQSCKSFCSFCPTHILHGRFKQKSLEKVLADIDMLINTYSFSEIQFHDDNFLDRDDSDKIMDYLGKKGVPWVCFARSDNIRESILEKMKETGCRHFFIGIESGNQQILDYFEKGTTVAQNKDALQLTDRYGINTEAGVIIGAPADTIRTIMDTYHFLINQPLDYLGISVLQVNPGCLEWRRAINKGKFQGLIDEEGNFLPEKYVADKLEPYNLPTVCENIAKRDLNYLVDVGYAIFYLRQSQFERLSGRIQRSVLKEFLQMVFNNLRSTLDEVPSNSEIYPLAKRVYQSSLKEKIPIEY